MKGSVLGTAAFGVMVLAGTQVATIRPTVNPPIKPPGLDAHETHAASSLLGQFRTSTSAWLWLRTDLYLHNGVEMRLLTEDEIKAGVRGVGGKEDGHEELHDDSKIVTVIPSKENDFRGAFGDIERQTKTYDDMSGHNHNDPESALPLFRLMTWLDPQFIPGWVTGGMVIARNRTNVGTQKALAFLQQGLENNPESIAIRTEIARLLLSRERDMKGAIQYLQQAVELGWKHRENLPEDEFEAVSDSFRWLALANKELGRFDESRHVARFGLKMVPDDPLLLRLSNPAPLILTAEDQKRWYERISGQAVSPQTQPKNPMGSPKERLPEDSDHGHNHSHDHGHDHSHDHGHNHSH